MDTGDEQQPTEEPHPTIEQVRLVLVRLALLAMRYERTLGKPILHPETPTEERQREYFSDDERGLLARIISQVDKLYKDESEFLFDHMYAHLYPWLGDQVRMIRSAEDPEKAAIDASREMAAKLRSDFGFVQDDDALLNTIKRRLDVQRSQGCPPRLRLPFFR